MSPSGERSYPTFRTLFSSDISSPYYLVESTAIFSSAELGDMVLNMQTCTVVLGSSGASYFLTLVEKNKQDALLFKMLTCMKKYYKHTPLCKQCE